MQSRFTSSEYSDSYTQPYYADGKPPTAKRKELAKKMSVSSVDKSNSCNDISNGSVINNRSDVFFSLGKETDEKVDSNIPYSVEDKDVEESSAKDPQKRYSLPHRAVSFSDPPDHVNQTTEVVAL